MNKKTPSPHPILRFFLVVLLGRNVDFLKRVRRYWFRLVPRRFTIVPAVSCRVCFYVLTGFLSTIAFFPEGVEASEFSITPSLTLAEEYNDNIFLSRANKTEEYITRAIPAVLLHYKTSFWTWDADYTLEFRHYGRHSVDDEVTNILHAKNHTEVINNLVYLDVSDDLSRVSLDITRDYTQQSIIVNQAQQNILIVNPYMVLKPLPSTFLSLGYMYRDTRYYHVITTTGLDAIDRIDNIAYIETKSELSSQITLTTGVRYTQDRNKVENYNQLDAYVGSQYTYAPGSNIHFQVGERWLELGNNQKWGSHFFWFAGISHQLSMITGSLEASSLYVHDPGAVLTRQVQYRAALRHETPRNILTLSAGFGEYRDGQSDTLLTTSQDAQLSLLYRFTPRTSGFLSTSYQNIENKGQLAFTRINLNTLRVEHLLAERFTAALVYHYLQSHSPVNVTDNYINNRAIIEFRKVF